MYGRYSKIMAAMLCLLAAGCAIQSPPQPQIPDETRHEGGPPPSRYGIGHVSLDFVRIGQPGRFKTPIIVGLTADNTCAIVLSHEMQAHGRGIHVALTLMRRHGLGLRCGRYPTPVIWQGDYPMRMRPGEAWAIEVSVNGRVVGIVETRVPEKHRLHVPRARIERDS